MFPFLLRMFTFFPFVPLSISSGDSVLVGVEDNPEFKNYSLGEQKAEKTSAATFVGASGQVSNNPLFANMDNNADSGNHPLDRTFYH